MNRFRWSRLACAAPALLLLLPLAAAAQDAPPPPWVKEVLQSEKLHEERTLLVKTPAGYETSTDSFPVMVLLDADDRPQFEAAIANANFLESRNEIPGLIIVGVTNGKDRTHDMTPPTTGADAGNFPTSGGADAFEDFITDEVLPFIRGKYRARAWTLLAGHSFGGLFGLHVAATRQYPYKGIIAMSPSIWWNDSTVVAPYADALARETNGLRLFVTSGAYEGPIDRPTRRFIARLDSLQPRGIHYQYMGLPDATHGLTPAPSLAAGLRYVFEPVSVARLPVQTLGAKADSAAIVDAFRSSEATYAQGARSLSLPESLPEGLVNQLGYVALQYWKQPAVGVWIFEKNVAAYPGHPNVYDSYGDGLVAEGDTTAAVAQYRKAVDMYQAEGGSQGEGTRKKLEALEKAAKASGGRE